MPKPKKIVKGENIPKTLSAGEDKPKTDSDIEQQFEVELCWCIQQLHTALRIGKLNSKQGLLLVYLTLKYKKLPFSRML